MLITKTQIKVPRVTFEINCSKTEKHCEKKWKTLTCAHYQTKVFEWVFLTVYGSGWGSQC